ncbi:monocarboxylate transporter 1-like protein [Lates japonicus]|uniref:Monocarboxylate transporter 1 n=1 Tax=Lates japonicus TaxID=270547 RepID=A0AAD3QYD2_LATJO|nr:monocarboxylate transporter 1-like protein [Lates japonicus]
MPAVLYMVCHVLARCRWTTLDLVYAIFFGFAFGWLSAVLFETLMDLVGAQRFSSAVGLVTIVECAPVLLGPPLTGTFYNYYHHYDYTYITCGIILMIASVFLFVRMGINYYLLERERKEEERRRGPKEGAHVGTSLSKSRTRASEGPAFQLPVTMEPACLRWSGTLRSEKAGTLEQQKQ